MQEFEVPVRTVVSALLMGLQVVLGAEPSLCMGKGKV